MPWSVADVDDHHKGLSAREKRVWVRVANDALRRCMADGKSEGECDASAIRQANAVVNRLDESIEGFDILEWLDEFLETRSFEQTREVIQNALQDKLRRGKDTPYPWIMQTFPENIVYNHDGKIYRVPYSIDDTQSAGKVTLGEPVEVEAVYRPIDEAAESEVTSDFIPIREKALRKDGTADIKIIQPGWGSSGYYSREMLQRDGPKIFTKGTKMYWDHPTSAEEADRPERSLRDLAAELKSDAEWRDRGPSGPGLYATAKVFETFAKPVEELAPHIGVSIRGLGKAKEGTVEGRKGPVIEQLVRCASVDFVTEPGAGGQIVQLFESARERPAGGNEMDENEAKALREANDKAAADIKALQEANDKLKTELERLQEADLGRRAAEHVVAKVNETALPEATRKRIAKRILESVPTKDGDIDEEELDKRVDAAIEDEKKYIESLGVSPIRGMNSESTTDYKDEDFSKNAESVFTRLGLSEGAAKVAANGKV